MVAETILAIAAHNDDHIIGAGGTLAKYAQEGKRVISIICAYGEKSHPHLRKEVVVKWKTEEARHADRVIGGKGVTFLDLKEKDFLSDIKRASEQITEIIEKERPSKIFTHGADDAHQDHRAVNRIISKLIDEKVITCPVYSFEIWSIFKLRKRNRPRMVINISDTFKTKIKAFLMHESQTIVVWSLLWKLIIKDLLSGIIHGYKYAEVFYRIN